MLAALENMIQAVAPYHIKLTTAVKLEIPGSLVVGDIAARATITDVLRGTTTWNPVNIAANDHDATTMTVTGAAEDDIVTATLSTISSSNVTLTCVVSTTDTVRCVLFNAGAADANVGSGNLNVLVWKSS